MEFISKFKVAIEIPTYALFLPLCSIILILYYSLSLFAYVYALARTVHFAIEKFSTS